MNSVTPVWDNWIKKKSHRREVFIFIENKFEAIANKDQQKINVYG